MSKIGLVVLLSFLSGRALSQDYFVFIGSDHRQPFFVRLDSQLYSSSPEGHILLAPLKDSDYTMTIGFPGDLFPEMRYALSVRGKDLEFELRKQDDGSWRLYDVGGQHWVTAQEKERGGGEIVSAGIKKDDAFSRMMAGVVHDTAVLYNTFAMEQTLKDSPVVKSLPVKDSALALRADSPVAARADSSLVKRVGPGQGASTLAVRGPGATTPGVPVPGIPAPGVVKVSEKKSSRSIRQVYTDNKDTVVVIIPRDTVTAGRVAAVVKPVDTAGREVAAVSKPIDTAGRGAAAVVKPIDTAGREVAAVVKPIDTAGREGKTIGYINSDCHNFATDYDVDRLRVKMLAAAKDEDRLAAARKVFRTKCFYTPQVRALSEVFASDAGKYRFFEVAWPFAADEHFRELSALLTDPVYLSKFKTLTGGRP